MQTAIIIPTYNNEEYTIRCMKSIADHTENYFIIWVDDGSSRESIEKVKSFLSSEAISCETILKEENTGFAATVNLGLERALEKESTYIVIQNNDTEVFDGWLTGMIRVAESDDIIGAVGPITSPCMSLQSVGRLKEEFEQFEDLPEYNEDPAEYARLISEHYKGKGFITNRRLAFFSVLLKGEVVRKIGMMSEEYGVGFAEDDDYMLRLRQKGLYGAIAQDVFVFHDHNTTFRGKYSPQEIDAMRRKNWDILHRKFKKGKYRPENYDLIFDLEELATLAKQLQKSVEEKDEKIEQIRLINMQKLDACRKHLAERELELRQIRASRSYRLAQFFAKIYHFGR